MDMAARVFLNGIGGVFVGIAVLYVMMKLLAIVAGSPAPGAAPPARTSP